MAFLCKYLTGGIVFVAAVFMAEGLFRYPARIPFVIALVLVGLFFVTATEVWAREDALKYRRFLFWREIPYEQIVRCDNSWSPWCGYLKLNRFVPPWGKIYFVKARPGFSGDPKELISLINLRRAGVTVPVQQDDQDRSAPKSKDIIFCVLFFGVGILWALILDNIYGQSQPNPELGKFPVWIGILQTLLYRATTWPWVIGTVILFVAHIVWQRFQWISAAIVGGLLASIVLRDFH